MFRHRCCRIAVADKSDKILRFGSIKQVVFKLKHVIQLVRKILLMDLEIGLSLKTTVVPQNTPRRQKNFIRKR